MMNIYFAGSMMGGRQDAHIYLKIVELLKTKGHVFTEHVADATHDDIKLGLTPRQIWDRDMKWLYDSDLIVAEVTVVSLGVGYELGVAEKLGKRVICMYRKGTEKKLSNMIRGNSKFKILEYNDLDSGLKALEKEL